MADDHVIWVGINPELLLEGLDTKTLFGCENYLKFNLISDNLEKVKNKDIYIKEEPIEVKLEENIEESEYKCRLTSSQKGTKLKREHKKENNAPALCIQCGKSFVKRKKLLVHLKEVHLNEYKYNCNQCKVAFKRNAVLKRHVDTKHNNVQFLCSKCNFKTHYPRMLKLHELHQHTWKEPKCNQCSFIGADRNEMRHHQKSFHGKAGSILQNTDRIKCTYCDKTYADQPSLTKHNMAHTGEKSHKCDTCEKAFIQKGALKQHLQVHTGEKPFKCQHCDQAFTRSIYRNHHTQKLHSKVTSDNDQVKDCERMSKDEKLEVEEKVANALEENNEQHEKVAKFHNPEIDKNIDSEDYAMEECSQDKSE
jgi:hypothetical protein